MSSHRALLLLQLPVSLSQASTYFIAVTLSSIAILVFLNASTSFLITARIGQREHVGDAVGSLGFADECFALVACPIWGVISDRVGVRFVTVTGYLILASALMGSAQASSVVPGLLLWRVIFSVGAAANSTMITAILPTMTRNPTDVRPKSAVTRYPVTNGLLNGHHSHAMSPSVSSELTITPANFRSSYFTTAAEASLEPDRAPGASAAQIAGWVGMFSGFGALFAVVVLLPLPARFEKGGISPSDAVADSFRFVAVLAVLLSIICFFGLCNLPGESEKGWHRLWKTADGNEALPLSADENEEDQVKNGAVDWPIWSAARLASENADIGLAYLGGSVARASSVAISLFVPLRVNAYFIESGLCPSGRGDGADGQDPDSLKRNCRRAYVLAAALTGVSQLLALIAAPVFGYLAGRFRRFNIPLLFAAGLGVVGYIGFGVTKPSDPRSGSGSSSAFLFASLLGLSQIGVIVCSLGLLGRGIGSEDIRPNSHDHSTDPTQSLQEAGALTRPDLPVPVTLGPPENGESLLPRRQLPSNARRESVFSRTHSTQPPQHSQAQNGQVESRNGVLAETAPLLHSSRRQRIRRAQAAAAAADADGDRNDDVCTTLRQLRRPTDARRSRRHLSGSIAGVYSLCGGAGILLLTKVGGYLFDSVTPGAPFFLMAALNGLLLLFGSVLSLRRATVGSSDASTSPSEHGSDCTSYAGSHQNELEQ